MIRTVIDASVLGAVVFGEPDAERWADILDGRELHAPSLLPYELASIARRKCRLAPDAASSIITALSLALDPRRALTLHDPNPVDVALLANATGLSPYDASYLWLAGFLGAELVTADRRLADVHDAFVGV